MTNKGLTNKYLRGMLARELLGIRAVKQRANKMGMSYNDIDKMQEAVHLMHRVQSHLDLYAPYMVSGNPEPLQNYFSYFAGH